MSAPLPNLSTTPSLHWKALIHLAVIYILGWNSFEQSVALAFLLIYNFNSQTRQQDHLFASLTSANDLLFSLGHVH